MTQPGEIAIATTPAPLAIAPESSSKSIGLAEHSSLLNLRKLLIIFNLLLLCAGATEGATEVAATAATMPSDISVGESVGEAKLMVNPKPHHTHHRSGKEPQARDWKSKQPSPAPQQQAAAQLSSPPPPPTTTLAEQAIARDQGVGSLQDLEALEAILRG